jgi:hypothetical protein
LLLDLLSVIGDAAAAKSRIEALQAAAAEASATLADATAAQSGLADARARKGRHAAAAS